MNVLPAVNVVRVDFERTLAARTAPLEVVLGNGRYMRMGIDFDAATLARPVSTLEHCHGRAGATRVRVP